MQANDRGRVHAIPNFSRIRAAEPAGESGREHIGRVKSRSAESPPWDISLQDNPIRPTFRGKRIAMSMAGSPLVCVQEGAAKEER